MKLTVDPEADALYLRLNETEIADSEQVASGIVLDYDAHDNVVGVEVLRLSNAAGRSMWKNRCSKFFAPVSLKE